MKVPRILVVAQAFKESLSPAEVAGSIRQGAEAAGCAPTVLQGSDGGDGLLDALGGRLTNRTVHRATDPLGRSLDAQVGWLTPSVAVVESRLVVGLGLLRPEERDPIRTTSRGLGELIRRVVGRGASTIVVGLGGSATVDGGLGMARAWGWEASDARGTPLADGGGALVHLATLRVGTPPAAELVALCDVTSPLLGERGARVFAPQKGATPDDVLRLEEGLGRLASLAGAVGRTDWSSAPGAGAAGGLGFGLAVFGGARLVPGAPWVLERIGFAEALGQTDAVMIAEGAFDRTSLEGKLAGEVIRRARAARLPTVLLAPTAADVPDGVIVETGGSWWDASTLARRAADGVRRALRLPRP